VMENADLLAELGKLRDEGLAIGFSVSGPRQTETIRRGLDVNVDGRPLFAAVQVTWNLLEQSTTTALREAHVAGVGVIVKEALANGRLTARNRSPEFHAQRALLQEIAHAAQTSVDALSLAAVLRQPWATVVLSGAANVDHLHSNLAALDVEWTEEMAGQLSALVEPADLYWQTRSNLPWN
jgi:aryl-alcohol dehydrogenase-like predicted oxidoreductase